MGRPWTWVLTVDGELHATVPAGWLPSTEVTAVCGEPLATGSAPVGVVARPDPCLCCLQVVSVVAAINRPVPERVGAT